MFNVLLIQKGLRYLDDRPVFPRERACAEAWWELIHICYKRFYMHGCTEISPWKLRKNFQHEKRKFISPGGHIIFLLNKILINQIYMMMVFLHFWKISDNLVKISEVSPKVKLNGQMNDSQHFSKISKTFWRLPRQWKMFWSYISKFTGNSSFHS